MGSFITTLRWGRDLDIIDSTSKMSQRDIQVVQSTWRPIYKEAGDNGVSLFLGLFRKNPVTKTFFKTIKDSSEEEILNNKQFRAHAINLMSSFNTAVENLHEPDVVIALMNKLGVSHNARKIKKEHFNDFSEILFNVLKTVRHLNEAQMESWQRYIDFIYKHIFEELSDD